MRPFREELKFIIHHSVQHLLRERWRRYLVRAPFTNPYAVSAVLSQYYDSPTLQFYTEKLDGIPIRSKVRLRTYGYHRRPGVSGFLEIKYRVRQKIRKFREPFAYCDARQLDPDTWTFADPRHRAAFGLLRQRYRLVPSAQVFYQREAYQGLVESDVRVTFDTFLLALHPGERITPALMRDRSRQMMPDTLAILEVKATGGIPGWVHEGIRAMELQQKTIPKYVTAVEVLHLPALIGSGVYL